MPPDQVRELLQVARRRRFSRNEVVFHRDDPGDSVHLISKGRFAIQVMTPLGETSTIAIRGPGESFGEMALVGGTRRSATVLSLEDAETFSIYQPEFERIRRQHLGVGDVLTKFLVNEVRMLNERLLEALYVPVERRVLRRLGELAELYPAADGVAVITLTQEALAELSGPPGRRSIRCCARRRSAARSSSRAGRRASSTSTSCADAPAERSRVNDRAGGTAIASEV